MREEGEGEREREVELKGPMKDGKGEREVGRQ